eukprot:2447157-Rhodomonas_salina.1
MSTSLGSGRISSTWRVCDSSIWMYSWLAVYPTLSPIFTESMKPILRSQLSSLVRANTESLKTAPPKTEGNSNGCTSFTCKSPPDIVAFAAVERDANMTTACENAWIPSKGCALSAPWKTSTQPFSLSRNTLDCMTMPGAMQAPSSVASPFPAMPTRS